MQKSSRYRGVVRAMVLTTLLCFSTVATMAQTYVGPARNATPVVLKWWMIGDNLPDNALVLAELNKRLSAQLNTTLDVQYISWADFGTKYPLLFAAGEDFDAIYTSSWSFYIPQASKNGFLELTPDLLKKNAPNVWANTPKAFWDQVKIKGKVFMVPQLHKEYGEFVVSIRGDLRKKYGLPPIKSFDQLEPYLSAVAKNEKEMVPFNVSGGHDGLFAFQLAEQWAHLAAAGQGPIGEMTYDITNSKSSKLTPIWETAEFRKIGTTLADWYKKGYINKDTMVQKTFARDLFNSGKSAVFVHNMNTVNSNFVAAQKDNPKWEIEVFDPALDQKVLGSPAIAGGIGLHATTKYADRTLQVIDYIRYDRETNYLVQRGILGRHWDFVDAANPNITKPGPNAADYGGSFTWGPARNWDFLSEPDPASAFPGYGALMKSLDSRKVNHPLETWAFDNTKVKSEETAVRGVLDSYFRPLTVGVLPFDVGLNNLRTKLKAAGWDKVQAEMQKQADAYFVAYQADNK